MPLDRNEQFNFVGRDEQFAVLKTAVDSAVVGMGRVVTIVGEAGAGKTRIAAEVSKYAVTQSCHVASGRCREISGAPAYWPWTQMLRQVAEFTGIAVPEEFSAFTEDNSIAATAGSNIDSRVFRAHESISTYLEEAARQAPLLLWIEDIHWADSSSLAALEYFADSVINSQITLLITQRDPENAPDIVFSTLGEISRQPNHSFVNLPPLTEDAVNELLFQRDENLATAQIAEQILEQSSGNALYVTELIRLLIDSGSSELGSTISQLGVPRPVAQILTRRLDSLPEETVALLEMAAVLGRNIDPDETAAMADINRYSLAKSLSPGLATGLINNIGDGVFQYEFSHELVRVAFLDRLDTVRLAELNLMAAKLREQGPDDELPAKAGILAHHYELASPLIGDEPAIEFQILAGEFANSRLASPEARIHLEKAVEKIMPGLIDEVEQLTKVPHREILVSPLDISKLTDQAERCLRAYALSLAGVFDESRASIVNKAAFDYLVVQGRNTEATQIATISHSINNRITRDMYRTALEIAEPGDPHRVTLLSKWATQHGNDPDPNYEQAINFHQQAVGEATRIGESIHLAWSTSRLAMSHIWFGHWNEGIQQATRAVAFSEDTDDIECQVNCYMWSIRALLTVGDKELATSFAEKAVIAANRTQHQLRLAQAHRMQALVDFHSGRLGGAIDQTRAVVETVQSDALLGNLVMLNANLGLVDDIGPLVETIIGWKHESGIVVDSESDAGATLARLAVDTNLEILPLLEIKRMLIPGQNMSNIPYLSMPWWIGKGFFGILSDDRELVQDVYEHELLNAGIIAPTVTAFSASNDRSLGKFAEYLGENEKAIGHYEDALKFLRPDDFKFELAWTCHDYSKLLIGHNEFARAAELIDEGLAITEECELVLLGGKLNSLQEIVKEAQSNIQPFGLTRRELDVLELLAIGLANREIAERLFVTENTVRSHAQSIYSKTGLSGRAAVARFAIEHGLAPESV